MSTPAHLGGHFGVTNTDPATLAYLVERFVIRSMLDVGCGPGGMLDAAAARGVAATGIDGDPGITRPDIVVHDYTQGPLVMPAPYDLVWCVEFAEHVEAEYIPHFLATFRAGRVLLFSHALPGQGGHHHVNEQPADYWAAILTADGWMPDPEATAWVRVWADDRYVRKTGGVWTRCPSV